MSDAKPASSSSHTFLGRSHASPERLTSLDAYRGFIMLAMASAGLGIPQVARSQGGVWSSIASQLDHVPWVGCAAWDLIQPAFMFMVGVAIPYSYGKREQQGDSWGRMFRHAAVRSIVLVLLGVFLASAWSKQTNWVFTNVLAQIGLGYLFVFLLRGRSIRMQAAVFVLILAGTWCLFLAYPAPEPGPSFDYAAHGLPADWPLLPGIAAHWNKHTNVAAHVDLWLLNQFPRESAYALEVKGGGYHTLNFLPSIATMILGLMAGELLRSNRSSRQKLLVLIIVSATLLLAGMASGWTICPIVKRIWTPSWVLFSGAWVVGMLAVFFAVVDVAGWRRAAFPLVVVGMNSIVMYMMAQLMKGWTWSMVRIHVRPLVESPPGEALLRLFFGPEGLSAVYLPIIESASVLLVFWLICWWLYRQRVFVRI